MLPFRVQFKPGENTYEQIVYAVKKAVIAGALKPGDRFPSVRALSQELRINPTTAQKAVAALVEEKLLTVNPGIGTVVTGSGRPDRGQLNALLGPEVERLVVEARRLGLEAGDLTEAVKEHWNRLSQGTK